MCWLNSYILISVIKVRLFINIKIWFVVDSFFLILVKSEWICGFKLDSGYR